MALANLIDRQLDAYLEKNTEKLLTYYDDNIRFISMDNGKILLEGKNEIRNNHEQTLFNRNNLNVEILARIILDDIVIDLEKVTGLKKPYAISFYKIKNNRISEIWCKNGITLHFRATTTCLDGNTGEDPSPPDLLDGD